MSPLLKKILQIIALLLVAGLIAFALYWFFFHTSAGQNIFSLTTPKATTSTTGLFPPAGVRTSTTGPGGATGTRQLPSASGVPTGATSYYQSLPVNQIVSDYAIFPSVAEGGSLRYQNGNDGKFYERLPDGTITKLSDQVFYNVSNVTWGNKDNKAIIEYPDQSKILYNFESEKQVTVPKHWSEFSFSPDDSQFAAKSMAISPENRSLVTAKDDVTDTKVIEPMGIYADRVTVDWSPSRQTVAFSQTAEPLGGERREILFVGLNHENFRGLTTEGFGFQPQWSPSGQRLLYSVYSTRSQQKPELWITNSYGDLINTGRQNLKLYTWADKCTFANEKILYCAVPRDIPVGAALVPGVVDYNDYDIVKIDTNSNLKTALPLGDETYKIDKIFYDKATNKIMFTDRTKTGVFEVNI